MFGWLNGFNVGLEARSGLLPTIWESLLKGGLETTGHGILILGQMASPLCYQVTPTGLDFKRNTRRIFDTSGVISVQSVQKKKTEKPVFVSIQIIVQK